QSEVYMTRRHVNVEIEAEYQHDLALDKSAATRASQPFYLGKSTYIVTSSLSPSGQWMLVVTQPRNHDDGKSSVVNHYVTDSGYTEAESVRPYVGRNKPAPQSVWLLDLASHQQYKLSLEDLPGIHTDPLAKLRAQTQAALRKAGHDDEAKALKAPETRSVSVTGFLMHPIKWSADGKVAAIELRANDNKDRWIATVDLADHRLVTQDHLHDPAWISWSFNRFGFIPRSHTLWYVSEATGYSQLYTKTPGGSANQLTSGHFEVSAVTPSADGKWFYVKTNREAPYAYDVYRVPTDGGDLQRVTHFGAIDGFTLSPDGSRLAVRHSSAYVRPQLAVVNVDGSGAKELTDTRTAKYKAMQWVQPKIVKVPSTHGAGDIYAKLWVPKNFDAGKP